MKKVKQRKLFTEIHIYLGYPGCQRYINHEILEIFLIAIIINVRTEDFIWSIIYHHVIIYCYDFAAIITGQQSYYIIDDSLIIHPFINYLFHYIFIQPLWTYSCISSKDHNILIHTLCVDNYCFLSSCFVFIQFRRIFSIPFVHLTIWRRSSCTFIFL